MEYSSLPVNARDIIELDMSRKDRRTLTQVSKSLLSSTNELSEMEYFQKRRTERLLSDLLDRYITLEDNNDRQTTWKSKCELLERILDDEQGYILADLFTGDVVSARIGLLVAESLSAKDANWELLLNTSIMEGSIEAVKETLEKFEEVRVPPEDRPDYYPPDDYLADMYLDYSVNPLLNRGDPDVLREVLNVSGYLPFLLQRAVCTSSLEMIEVILDFFHSGDYTYIDDDDTFLENEYTVLLTATTRGRSDVIDLLYNYSKLFYDYFEEQGQQLLDLLANVLNAALGVAVPRLDDPEYHEWITYAYIVNNHGDLLKTMEGYILEIDRGDHKVGEIARCCIEAIDNGYYGVLDSVFQHSYIEFITAMYACDKNISVYRYLLARVDDVKKRPDITALAKTGISTKRQMAKLLCEYRSEKFGSAETWDELCHLVR
jgi:hypothetical protein